MKKLILLTFSTLLALGINAQSLLPVKYSIKVGVNISSPSIFRTEKGINNGVKPTTNCLQIGVSAGVCVYIPLSDKWYIKPEVLYSQKGVSFDYDFTHDFPVDQRAEYVTTNQLTLSYVELNPTFSFKASNKLTLNFGPSVSYLISEDYTITSVKNSGEDATGANVPLDGFYTSTPLDVGLNLGLSYFIAENLLLRARVSTGFMEAGEVTQPNETGDSIPTYTLKTKAILLSLAYLF